MSNIQDLFLSDDNLTLIFNMVSKKVYQQGNYNISNDKSMKKTFLKMSKIVYNSLEPHQRSLQSLNQVLADKSSKFFIDMLQKKNKPTRNKNSDNNIRQLEENNIRVNMRPNPIVKDNKSINDRLKEIENERNQFKQNSPQNMPSFEDNTPIPNNTNKMYQNLINSRKNVQNFNNSINNQNQNTFNDMNNENLNVLSYDANDISGLTMEVNPKEYNSQVDENHNPMDLYKLQNQQRQTDEKEYVNFLNTKNSFEDNIKEAENNDKVNLNKINEERLENGQDFYKNLQYNSGNLSRPDSFMFKDTKFRNDSPEFDLTPKKNEMTNIIENQNPNYELIKRNMFEKQKYIEKSHMVTISSLDRNWTNNQESRYNYQVKFKNTDDTNLNSAYIRKIFRNVVSVELVRAFLPYDTIPIPFDFRMNIGLQTFPFLVLDVDEINDVYSGTNKNIDNSFAHIVFDKDYKNQLFEKGAGTASSGGIDVDDSAGPHIPVAWYEKQYIRGNYGYIPIGFEKKKFYPAPLASLNSLTINLKNPYGESLNVMRDTLTIKSITFVDGGSNYQISGALGFPVNDSNTTTYHVIKITTNEKFSNRVFSIGDRIRFKDFTLVSGNTAGDEEFINFINREEGHYVINMNINTPSATNTQDFVDSIYISPMGSYDQVNNQIINGHSIDSYYQDSTSEITNTSGNLINISLQNSFIFKIITREKNVDEVINPINT